ncbi:UDP-3-O-acyl-N-acetylglucosamine deacetylase [Thioclava kandeliae]|uniref:UDP-3-O-acyl-N-acetylglucosamine deacetylase n=1 Tax=Thioclava kandeliae TaxID=3070818 RepID=A0ABV1SCD0_9RHOB
MQTSLAKPVSFDGVGLHKGQPVRMRLLPAPADHGIVFNRVDVAGNGLIPALWNKVTNARLCTLIENEDGITVSTIEHIMAALAGCGVHNALIEIDGPEVPILDGSSAPFVEKILAAGLVEVGGQLRALRILRPVEVRDGAAWARLDPNHALEIDFSIDFTDRAIGQQRKRLGMSNGAFVRELMDSRTFCRRADVEMMQKNGLALGGTYENAVVIDGDKVLSPGGLRHKDEAVRHKMLDALGDLLLAGGPILGRYVGNRSGHAMTNSLLRAVFANPAAYEWVVLDSDAAHTTPGAGVCVPQLFAAQ